MSLVLQVRQLSKSFAGVHALVDAQLDVAASCVHVVMGENGAGKSTLMKILAGLYAPDSGEILLNNQPLRLRGARDASQKGIAMIHQELMPFRDLSVAENIAIGREPCRGFLGWIDRAAMHSEAETWLAKLRVSIDPARRMGDLSIAEMQTVEIAKALAHNASVLIMDEPTTALSSREVTALFRVIEDLKNTGVAIIYISHKMDEIFQIADTITVMRDGHHITTQPSRELNEVELIRLMVGRDPVSRSLENVTLGDTVLEVRDLESPGKFRRISFSLKRGEILGLAGLMGAGRTELAHAIYGLEPASNGSIHIDGKRSDLPSPASALAAGIALVGEDRKRHGFVSKLSIRENLMLSSMKTLVIHHHIERLLADEQIKIFGIKITSQEQAVEKLSGGNQQKVVIAKALLTNPKILILDEPTRGIDIGAKSEIHALITRLARSGMAVFLISSELPELLALSNRILVMRAGEITAEIDSHQATQEEILRHAMPV